MLSSHLHCWAISGLLISAVACSTDSSQASSRDIKVDGSSTVFVVSEAVAEEFQKLHRNIRVTVGQSGTGGFQKFCRGETDISDASRPVRPAEIETCRAAGIEFVELPIAYDGIAIVANQKAPWIDSITTDELKALWRPEAQGTITRWSQVRPGRLRSSASC